MADKKQDRVLAFRLTDKQLEEKINEFRKLYADGSRGMVTWARFCAFLGYSIDEVRECYERGKLRNNAYMNRAIMLERFHSEVRAMTVETSQKNQLLAKAVSGINYLVPEGQEKPDPELHILFGNGDGRWFSGLK